MKAVLILTAVLVLLSVIVAALNPTSSRQVSSSATSSTRSVSSAPSSSVSTTTTTVRSTSSSTSSSTTSSTASTTTTIATTTTPAPPTTVPVAPDLYYSGVGDQVQSLGQTVTDARIVTLTHQGDSNFVVKALSVSGADSLLVNEIGSYSGTVPLAFAEGDAVNAFEINASGPWTITIKDLRAAPELAVAPGARFDGTGDGVVRFLTASRQPLKVSCPGCQSNVVVKAYGRASDLLVNEIGAYDGTVLVPASTVVLEVHAGAGFRGPQPSWFLVVS